VVALIAFFNAHDSPTTSTNGGGGGPGQADTTASTEQLRAGNIVLQYSNPADAASLRAIARAEAGTDKPDASLVAAGQAVILARIPSSSGVTARAYQRTLHAPNGKDPAVEDFVSAYLGQGAQ
jgi:hypothetical protein